jgi:hypothetical protein
MDHVQLMSWQRLEKTRFPECEFCRDAAPHVLLLFCFVLNRTAPRDDVPTVQVGRQDAPTAGTDGAAVGVS